MGKDVSANPLWGSLEQRKQTDLFNNGWNSPCDSREEKNHLLRKGSECRGLRAGGARLGRAVGGSLGGGLSAPRGTLQVMTRVRSQEIRVLVLTDFLCDPELLIDILSFVFSSKMRIRSPAPICPYWNGQ